MCLCILKSGGQLQQEPPPVLRVAPASAWPCPKKSVTSAGHPFPLDTSTSQPPTSLILPPPINHPRELRLLVPLSIRPHRQLLKPGNDCEEALRCVRPHRDFTSHSLKHTPFPLFDSDAATTTTHLITCPTFEFRAPDPAATIARRYIRRDANREIKGKSRPETRVPSRYIAYNLSTATCSVEVIDRKVQTDETRHQRLSCRRFPARLH